MKPTAGWPWTRFSSLYARAPPAAWAANDARNKRKNSPAREFS